ncbi:MAG: M50 family metallopeptidase [Actinomycetia bacterium]|nr:M50 family metallopeptidase [Actinomycetes bacterium]
MPFALQAILWGVITLSIVVFLHEGGHFLAARAFGVRVHEFMFGLPGPKIGFKRGDTLYGVTAIPFGGYNKIAGMDGDVTNVNLQPVLVAVTQAACPVTAREIAEQFELDEEEAKLILTTLADWSALACDKGQKTWSSRFAPELAGDPDALFTKAKEHTYQALSFPKRAVVLLTGIIINIIFALLVFTVVLSAWGQQVALNKVAPVAGGPALTAGIAKGDRIIRIDNTTIATFDDITGAVSRLDPGTRVTVTSVAPGASASARKQTQIILGRNPGNAKLGYLGIEAIPEYRRLSVPRAFGQSFFYVKMTVQGILGFFTPGKFTESINNSASVVGIAVIAADAAKTSAVDYAWLVAAISLSLGLMNLLPIPPLDGGKVIIEGIGALRRKPLGLKATASVSAVGLLVLVTFMVYVMGHDIFRIVK